MGDLETNVAALLRLISHYRLTGDIKKNNATLLKIIGSQIGTDCFGKPLADGGGRPKAESQVCASEPAARPGGSHLEVFTDGACIRNPGGDGGWGFVAVQDGKKIAEFCGPDPKTTSNRAELKAIIRALLWLPPGTPATIVTDSQLSIKILSGTWRAKKNLDLIEEARALMQQRRIKFRWVRGHAGNRWNEHADALATEGMGKASRKKIEKPKRHARKGENNADLRRRAEQDGLSFDDSLPAHLIP